MKYLVFFILCFSSFAFADKNLRVMTFNTTCAHLCEKGKFDKFKDRKHWIVDTIKRSNPDLIGMQEVLTSRQLAWFKRKLKDYSLIFYRKYYIFRYADPAIFVKKGRFSIKRHGGFWLGPKKWFNLGWKTRLPRRLQWVRLFDNDNQQEFYFVTSHFDNHEKNKTKSAAKFIKAFENVEHPVIFAGDTNIKPKLPAYQHLLDHYYDSFNIKENFVMLRNSNTNEHDSCNLEKGKTFPECRVDHIFLSKTHNWQVSNWVVDQFKYGKKNRFNSDHRAIYADIQF